MIDKAVDRYRKGKRTLTAAAMHYGVVLTDAHDAGADALAAGRVAQAIARLYGDQLGADVDALHQLQIGWCGEQAASFQEYMRRVKDPAFVTSGVWPQRLPLIANQHVTQAPLRASDVAARRRVRRIRPSYLAVLPKFL